MAASIAQHGPFLAPTGTKLAQQHPTSAPTGTKLAQQHPTSAPTGTKLAQQHPTSTPTGTKLTQQHPTSTPTGTKLARHTQNQQNSPILDMQGELSLAPAATPPSRANFLSHLTPLDTTHPYSQPQPVQNSPSNTPPAPQPVQNSPSNTPPAPQPVQNSPSNTPPAPRPVQNSPGTHKISKIHPFWTCRANFLSLIHHLGDDFHAADRHRLTVVHHQAHVAFCFFGPVSCTLKVASHGVPLQGAHTGLIRANSVHPVSTIKFPPTTTYAQIPTHPSTGQIPSGKLCTGLFGELERHTESAHS